MVVIKLVQDIARWVYAIAKIQTAMNLDRTCFLQRLAFTMLCTPLIHTAYSSS